MNVAQHKIVNLVKHETFFVIMVHDVFNVWLNTTLLPVWRRDTKRLDTPAKLEQGKLYFQISTRANIHLGR